jgi:FtsH-binding integral membrane protein
MMPSSSSPLSNTPAGSVPTGRLTPAQVAAEQAEFMRKVFAFMTGGLALTALTAWLVAHSPTALNLIVGNRLVFFGLIIAEIIMVMSFARLAQRLSASGAASLFFFYAIINGLTLSVIFLAYTQASIATAFLVTSGTFGGMSAYGYLTKRDLTGVGSFMMMGLWGLILASVVNLFLQSDMIYWLTTFAGVLIFVGLTAYDVQKITHRSPLVLGAA